MPIRLTADAMRKIFPRAPQDILDAFVAKQDILDKVGVSHSRTRLAFFFANIEHECAGFTIKDLTESIAYSAERMAAVWPSRFPGGADQVRRTFGTAPGWQKAAIDVIYGGRMGNRPYTHDGSTFIGRGGPQWTGRDGYAALAEILQDLVPGLAGATAEQAISYAVSHQYQPEVCAAFWKWKNLNAKADAGDFVGVVKIWNGGTNGLADREALLAGNDPIIARLDKVERILPVTKTAMTGAPPTARPPQASIDEATGNGRRLAKAGTALGGSGGVNQGAKAIAPDNSPLPAMVFSSSAAYAAIGIGLVVIVIACVVIARRRAAVVRNWF